MRKLILTNSNGLKAMFTNYGARLMSLMVPDMNGNLGDVVYGFDEPEDYLAAEEKYFGAIVGRYVNRIASGRFTLNGKTYHLTQNHPPNSLHGGIKGFHEKLWTIDTIEKNKLVMSCESPDREEGFPGHVKLKVTYHLRDDNRLSVHYLGTTNKATPINITHHPYFNLAGKGSILDHVLQIHADCYTIVNDSLIPTGVYEPVADTPFDFRKPKRIGQDIDADHPQLQLGNGYDHNFVLKQQNSKELVHAASVWEPQSKRLMEIHTNQPGIQFYAASWLSGKDIGKYGVKYTSRTAFCLETQHFPDTPNQTHFPSCILQPDEVYDYCCDYRFSSAENYFV